MNACMCSVFLTISAMYAFMYICSKVTFQTAESNENLGSDYIYIYC